MASTAIPRDRRSARVAIVEQHVQFENDHNLEGVLGTFGEAARYEDEAWGDAQVQQRHVTDDAILLEVVINGTHLGP